MRLDNRSARTKDKGTTVSAALPAPHGAYRGIRHRSRARRRPVKQEQTFSCGMLDAGTGRHAHPLRPKSPSFLATRRLHSVDLCDAPWLPGATCLSVCAHSKTARFWRALFWHRRALGSGCYTIACWLCWFATRESSGPGIGYSCVQLGTPPHFALSPVHVAHWPAETSLVDVGLGVLPFTILA